jgi:hypothetical protein
VRIGVRSIGESARDSGLAWKRDRSIGIARGSPRSHLRHCASSEII